MAGGWWAWLHNLAVLRLTIDAALFYVKSIVLLSLVVLDGGTCPASAFGQAPSPWPPQNTLAVEGLRAIDFVDFNLLFERSSDCRLSDPTGRHHENI
jgi:hypothetical protein